MDKVLMLGSEPILVGRATECQVQTQDAMVSRRHARIYWDGNYWIEDLGSSNGVYVGHDKVQKAPFRPGDTVTCGSLVLRLMPDTTPRTTGHQPPMTTGNMPAVATGNVPPATGAPSRSPTPPVGSGMMPPPAPPPPMASSMEPPPPIDVPTMRPPSMAPPGAPSSLAATIPPPRGDVQVGPNAVLRGAIASANAGSSGQSTLAEELRLERQKRTDAERALEDATREAALLKRKLDQMQADLKRLRGGQPPLTADDTRDDGELVLLRGRVAELEAQLRRGGAGAPADPAAADAAIALGDSLAELRASLRAANGEAGLLKAPEESVQVVSEALRSAAEQLETARAHLRVLGKLLGVG